MATKEIVPQPLKNQRSEDFASTYANNVALEASVWDLKLTFGELDQGVGVIAQHTSVTMSWGIAKLLVHFLRAQIIAHEIMHGKIPITQETLPPEVQPLPAEYKDNPLAQKVFETLKKEREEFLKTI